ncbi:MAG: hypothetical protein HQK51_19820, partial [Oligoflexia bacterium]|nr:hypothetical protein [Oligoflexia bacterium]
MLITTSNNIYAAAAPTLSMAPLEISNRAACADLSRYPARSIFLFIDGFSAGKAAYSAALAQRYGRSVDVDTSVTTLIKPSDYSTEGVKLFRLWSTHLAVDILNKILNAELPLLPIEEADFWPEYRKANESCINKNQMLTCPEMNDFLAKIWSYAHMKPKQQQGKWIEQGIAAKDFYPANTNSSNNNSSSRGSITRPTIGCHIVRKFSTFHSHLFTQKVDRGILENIAIDSINPEKYLNSCFTLNDDIDPRFATIQLDIANMLNDKVWDKYGFRVWHTLKLFLSWGWRYAPHLMNEFDKFDKEFRSIALEDSLMIVPNGCRSVDIPKCDKAGLSVDAMRAAKFLGT